MAQRVGQCADADLQRAAVAHQRAGVQADRVVDVAHRLPRQPEQFGIRAGGSTTMSKNPGYLGRAAEPWQFRIDLGHQQRPRQPARDDRVERVEGQVGVARQRQARAVGLTGRADRRAHQAVDERRLPAPVEPPTTINSGASMLARRGSR